MAVSGLHSTVGIFSVLDDGSVTVAGKWKADKSMVLDVCALRCGLVASSTGGSIAVWDPADGADITSLCHHIPPVWCVRELPKSRLASAGGGSGHTVAIWRVGGRHGKWPLLRVLRRSVAAINCLTALANGNLMVGSGRGLTREWDPSDDSDMQLTQKAESSDIAGLAVSPTGALAVLTKSRLLHLRPIAHSSTSDSLYVGQDETASAVQCNALSWLGSSTLAVGQQDGGLALHPVDPQGRFGGAPVVLAGHTKSVRVVMPLPGPTRRVMTGGDDRQLRVWDIHSGKCLSVTEGFLDIPQGVPMTGPMCKRITSIAVLSPWCARPGLREALWGAGHRRRLLLWRQALRGRAVA